MQSRGLIATVLRGGGWQTAAQLAPLVVTIVLTPVIIDDFGIDRYGLFILVNTVTTVLGLADGGMGAAALRYFSIYAGERDDVRSTRLLGTALLLVLGLATTVLAAVFWAVPAVLGLLDMPAELLDEGTFLLRTLIVTTAMAQMRNLFAALLHAHGRFALTSITLTIGHAIYLVGAVLTVSHDWGLYGIAVTMVVQQAVATLLIVPAALRHTDRRGLGVLDRAELRTFIRFALHSQWSTLMMLLTLQTDALLVGAFLPVGQVAYYGAGAQFAYQLRTVPFNASIPMQSSLGHAVGVEGAEHAEATFERLQRLWVIGTTGWGAVAIASAWFAVTAWLGDEFAISGVVAVMMLVAYQLTLWAEVLNLWTRTLGRPEINARSATVGAVANIVLTLALIFPFGIIGTVVATMLSQVLAVLALLRMARRSLPGGVRSFWRDVPVLPALAAAGTVVALQLVARPIVPQGPLGLLTAGALSAPGLVLYVFLTFGPRAVLGWLRRRRSEEAA